MHTDLTNSYLKSCRGSTQSCWATSIKRLVNNRVVSVSSNVSKLAPTSSALYVTCRFCKVFYAMHCRTGAAIDYKRACTGETSKFSETALLAVICVLYSSCVLFWVFLSIADTALLRVDAQRCNVELYAGLKWTLKSTSADLSSSSKHPKRLTSSTSCWSRWNFRL